MPDGRDEKRYGLTVVGRPRHNFGESPSNSQAILRAMRDAWRREGGSVIETSGYDLGLPAPVRTVWRHSDGRGRYEPIGLCGFLPPPEDKSDRCRIELFNCSLAALKASMGAMATCRTHSAQGVPVDVRLDRHPGACEIEQDEEGWWMRLSGRLSPSGAPYTASVHIRQQADHVTLAEATRRFTLKRL